MKTRYPIDTTSHLFVATPRRRWRNTYRFCATLTEPVNPDVLQQAVDDLAPRFPAFFVSLQHDAFTYYFEESDERLRVRPEGEQPFVVMSHREVRGNCVRVLYDHDRMAAELFHGVADGRGGYVFFCSLLARYVELRYGVRVPAEGPIRSLDQPPSAEELEDAMERYASEPADKERTRLGLHSYLPRGRRVPAGSLHLTTGIVDSEALLEAAHEHGVSVTTFLAALMVQTVMEMRDRDVWYRRCRPVRVAVAVDLRRLFESKTLRNFALTLNLGIDARMREVGLDQMCQLIHRQLRDGTQLRSMAAMIAPYVRAARSRAYRLLPVPIKRLFLNIAYEVAGEKCACMSLSNLGVAVLPEPVRRRVSRMEFVLGPLRSVPHNCGVLSYGNKTYINIVRTLREAELEECFFAHLATWGVVPEVSCDGVPLGAPESASSRVP